ncbi:MAG: T9SS type A sorting domain-containing protein [bacterium]
MEKVILFLILAMTQAAFSQWETCDNSIYGGDIRTVAVRENVIFAGTKGGIFFSNDKGNSWTPKNEGLFNVINAIANNGTYVFACSAGGGMYISSENGDNWVQKNEGLTNDSVNSIVISGSNVFIGTNAGVFLSNDNGDNWIEKNKGLANIKIITITAYQSKLYAGTASGIYVSLDDGNNWTATPSGLNFAINAIAANQNCIVAISDDGLYISQDNGISWVNKIITNNKAKIKTIGIYGNKIIAGTTGAGIFVSSDMAENWVPKNEGLYNTTISAMAIEANSIVVGTQNSRVYKADLTKFDVKPSFSVIDDFTIDQDSSKTIYFLVPSYASGGMIITKKSDNTELIPVDSIKISTLGGTRSLAIAPVKGKTGTCKITLSVTNGVEPAEESFTVTVIKGNGVEDNRISENLDLVLSPNPAGDYITVNLKPSEGFAVNIYSILGEIIKSVETRRAVSLRIDISDIPQGIYFVQAGVEIAKFVKK